MHYSFLTGGSQCGMGAAQTGTARPYVVWSGLSSSAGSSLPYRTLTTHRRPKAGRIETLGSQVAERLGNRASNLKVASWIPGRAKLRVP